jgi:hypothetical protein
MSQTIGIPQALVALAPGAQWILTGTEYSGLVWLDDTVPMPSEEAVNAEIAALTAQQPFDACKKKASELLYETDWTTIPDVADPTKSNPYLVNAQDYVVYRNALRQLAVHPVADPVWPAKPVSQWSA